MTQDDARGNGTISLNPAALRLNEKRLRSNSKTTVVLPFASPVKTTGL